MKIQDANIKNIAVDTQCSQCGKIFARLSPDWVYRRLKCETKYWYCSWHCFREAEK